MIYNSIRLLIVSIAFCVLIFPAQPVSAQQNNYTVLQAGGILGLQASSGDALSGYQLQFIFGKNFNDQTFLGAGLGTHVYRGGTEITPGQNSQRRVNTLPIFVDFRQKVAAVSPLGYMGVMANAGYAPSLGGNYYRGFSGKAGLTYSQMLLNRNDLVFTLAYGYQQFGSRYVHSAFNQHEVHLTVGLFVY